MDILIVANYTQMPNENMNGRFHYIAEHLVGKESDKVEIVTSSFSHSTKTQRNERGIGCSSYKFTMIEEPGYPKNVCLKRFYSHWVMSRNLKKYLERRERPDVVYCAVPSLDVAKVAAQYAKRNNIRFILDIQDLWPEAFEMVFHLPIISNLIYAPMKHSANYIYRQADEIIAVSETYCKRALMVNNKCKQSHAVFLGTRLSDFDDNVKQNPVELDSAYFYIAYCGTLGHSYDIGCVIDAIDILKKKMGIENIKFIVMGDGPLKAEFETYAIQKRVHVEFTGRLDYEKMCGLLSACDLVVNPIVHGSVGSIINKHADYAACGLPVLNTQESVEYRNLVEKYQMGFNCKNHNAEDLAEKIHILIEDSELREDMGKNARRCASEMFDRENTYKEIYTTIYNLKTSRKELCL